MVTGFSGKSLRTIRESLVTPNPPLTKAMIWPPWKIFQQFTRQFPDGTPLATMIGKFVEVCKTTRHYHPADTEEQMVLAHTMEKIRNIDLESRWTLSFAPIPARKKELVEAFIKFAGVVAQAKPVTIESEMLGLPLNIVEEAEVAMSPALLQELEDLHKLFSCFCWLSYVSKSRSTNHLECDGQHYLRIINLHNNGRNGWKSLSMKDCKI